MKQVLFAIVVLLIAGCEYCSVDVTQKPSNKNGATSITIDTLNSGVTNDLNAISFPSSLVGYVVGSDGLILKTIDGGQHWTASKLISYWMLSDSAFHAVEFWSEQDGAIVSTFQVFYTHDGAMTWDSVREVRGSDTIHNLSGKFYAIARSPSGALAIGGSTYALNSTAMAIASSSTTSPRYWQSKYFLSNASTISSLACTGDWFIATTAGFGQGFFGTIPSGIYTFSAYDQNFGTLLHLDYNLFGMDYFASSMLFAIGDSGHILRSSDKGVTWNTDTVTITSSLRGVKGSKSGNLVIVGDSVVLSAIGRPWKLSTLSSSLGPLRAVTFRDSTHAIAVGERGRMYAITFK